MNARKADPSAGPERRAAPVSEALGEFLRQSGLASLMKYPQLHEAWRKTVGEDMAEHARVSRFRNGALEIAVDSSALLYDIQFLKDALLKDLRREVKKPFVSKIVFICKPGREENDGEQGR